MQFRHSPSALCNSYWFDLKNLKLVVLKLVHGLASVQCRIFIEGEEGRDTLPEEGPTYEVIHRMLVFETLS